MNNAVSIILPVYKERKAVRETDYYFYDSISKDYFQLNPFGLQMLHDDIRISAGGFFTVDMHLFFSVNIAELKHTRIDFDFKMYFSDYFCLCDLFSCCVAVSTFYRPELFLIYDVFNKIIDITSYSRG
jgi:hypothetical protein